MTRVLPSSGLVAVVLLSTAAWAAAQELPLTREHHPWGRFNAGAWKRVRVTTETFDQTGGSEQRESETTVTLIAVDAERYTLRVEKQVKVAGTWLAVQPETITTGFLGEGEGQSATVEAVGEEAISISPIRKIPCQVFRVTVERDTLHRVSTLHFHPTVPPFVLRRTMHLRPSNGAVLPQEALVETLALEMPYLFRDTLLSTAYVRTVEQEENRRRISLEVQSFDVPGAVVSLSSKELDAAGKLVQRSTLELVDYGLQPPNKAPVPRRRLFRHRHRQH